VLAAALLTDPNEPAGVRETAAMVVEEAFEGRGIKTQDAMHAVKRRTMRVAGVTIHIAILLVLGAIFPTEVGDALHSSWRHAHAT
jgi:hypothetical protein